MSLTKVTYSMIQGAVVNAADYGASPSALLFTQFVCDSNSRNGIYLGQCNTIEFNNCWTSNRGTGDNFKVSTLSTDIRVIGGKVYNCSGHGIKISGQRTSLVGVSIENASTGSTNTYDDISLEDAISTLISGCRVLGTTRYGIRISSAGASDTRITGCILDNNTTGQYVDESSNDANNVILSQYQGLSASIANGATGTLYTFPAQYHGNYLFSAGQASNVNGGIAATAFVRIGTTGLTVNSLVALGGATLSASGMAVRITNTAGGAAVFDYSWIKI